ncbi:glycine betaine/L-proline ABC transporter ATP-binding protein ProV [candidate division KSB1 bacterium]|nr:glycine betaine/L-proline ABC transporter ATP-binding protein ProV [candidate division KSB1 bacterium]
MSVIKVEGLYKIFGHNPQRAFPLIEKGMSKEEVLDKTGCTIGIHDASFEIKQKETFVIMGLSGSGKSTVIRCLNRLIEPTRGQVLIDGKDIVKMNKKELMQVRRRKLSMVFQHFGLLPQRTVIANVEYGLEISGVDKDERREKALNAIELVGLKGYEESKPSELSGGMQQRVGLARALANDPEILLMDEAFSALDPLIRTQMQDELLELQARMHKTIVFITHDLDEALKIGDRIAIMKDGKVVQIGTPEEILTEPADEYVRNFIQNVDRSKVITASTIMRKPPTITVPKEGPNVAARRMEKHGVSTIYVVDSDRILQGILTIDEAMKLSKENKKSVDKTTIQEVYVTNPSTSVADLLPTAMSSRYPLAVVDDEYRLVGIVDRASIMNEVYGDVSDESTTSLKDYLKEVNTNGGSVGTKEEAEK